MKRITSINIQNYRVYQNESFSLENGGNLLIYGENGSGKSSLYRALKDYFLSSRTPNLPFVKNRYSSQSNGYVEIVFDEFQTVGDDVSLINGASNTFRYSSDSSLTTTQNSQYIKTASIVNGFLDYTDLLKVYLYNDARPNLFELVFTTLLGQHTPVRFGMTKSIKRSFDDLENDLFSAYTRKGRKHVLAINKLPLFETQLTTYLNEVFKLLNSYLTDYFNNFHIVLGYVIKPFQFSYGYRKSDWYLPKELKLTVHLNGIDISNEYNNILNEARLSAIAICMYLAALKMNASQLDFKMLFLDDVFIGLDAGNRLPILEILKTEFSDYQKIISTYDRQWFELAKRHLSKHEEKDWNNIEMYISEDNCLNNIKPIIIKGTTYIERAGAYLHHNAAPDYPAAANYIRKALEELIKGYLPKQELYNDDNIQIPCYKLSQLISRLIRFLKRIGENCTSINTIDSLLYCLLHPLSHHDIDSQIYKNELLLLEKAYLELDLLVKSHKFSQKYKCILESGNVLHLDLTTGDYEFHYEIKLNEHLIEYSNQLKPTICSLKTMSGKKGGVVLSPFTPNKDDSRFCYKSLTECLSEITKHIADNYTANFMMEIKPIKKYFNYYNHQSKGYEQLYNK